MRKTFAYFINFFLLLMPVSSMAQDTVSFPLKIRIGADIAGPGFYMSDKNNLSIEGYVSFDRSEKMAWVAEAGYLDYKYSQYNYNYLSKGWFTRIGVDFNLLKPDISAGKYQAGIGLRYGVSLFSSETPSFRHDNYWGTTTSSIPSRTRMGHFVEVTPGVRAEIFKNFSMGWNLRLKMLVSGGGGKDLRPIYFPGYGSGGKRTAAGISYYITWNIPYRVKTVITKPDAPEEPEDNEEPAVNSNQQRSVF